MTTLRAGRRSPSVSPGTAGGREEDAGDVFAVAQDAADAPHTQLCAARAGGIEQGLGEAIRFDLGRVFAAQRPADGSSVRDTVREAVRSGDIEPGQECGDGGGIQPLRRQAGGVSLLQFGPEVALLVLAAGQPEQGMACEAVVVPGLVWLGLVWAGPGWAGLGGGRLGGESLREFEVAIEADPQQGAERGGHVLQAGRGEQAGGGAAGAVGHVLRFHDDDGDVAEAEFVGDGAADHAPPQITTGSRVFIACSLWGLFGGVTRPRSRRRGPGGGRAHGW